MLQIDPYATQFASASVYNYALGNPVMINDPSGGVAWKPRTQQAAEWQLAIMNEAMEVALYGRNGMNGDADGSSRWGIAGEDMGRGSMNAWSMALSFQINSTLGFATDANGYAVIPDGNRMTTEEILTNTWNAAGDQGTYTINLRDQVWCPYCGEATETKDGWKYGGAWIPASMDNGRGFGLQGDPIFGHDFVDPNSFNFQEAFGRFKTEAYYAETFLMIKPLSGRVLDIMRLEINSIAIDVNGKKMSREIAQINMAEAFQDARLAVFAAFEKDTMTATDAREIFLRTLGKSMDVLFPQDPQKPNVILPETEFVFEGDVPISVIQLVNPRLFPTY